LHDVLHLPTPPISGQLANCKSSGC
jgi:hypothetical protein